jgi:hypothetical protein
MGVGLRKEFFLLADRDHRMPEFLSTASDYNGYRDQTLSGKGKTRGKMIIAPEYSYAKVTGKFQAISWREKQDEMQDCERQE